MKSVKEESDLTTIALGNNTVFGNSTITMMFDPKTYDLRQWTITDNQGKDTSVMIFNVKTGVQFDDKVFRVPYERDSGNSRLPRLIAFCCISRRNALRSRGRFLCARPFHRRGLCSKASCCPDLKGNRMSFSLTTWNINSVRLRMPIVEQLVLKHKPDILCLQETKVPNDLFPAAPLRAMGYDHIIIHGQKGYHGVAIASRFPLVEDHRQDYCNVGDAGTSRPSSSAVAVASACITSTCRPAVTNRTGRSIRNSATSSISSRK